MPTKKQKKKKKSSTKSTISKYLPSPVGKIPKEATQPVELPSDVGNYDTPTEKPIRVREPIRYSALNGSTSSVNTGYFIDMVSADGYLKSFTISACTKNLTLTHPARFRLDIERGGRNIFTSQIMLNGTDSQQNSGTADNLVLLMGDQISIDVYCDFTAGDEWSCFAAVVTQPFQ